MKYLFVFLFIILQLSLFAKQVSEQKAIKVAKQFYVLQSGKTDIEILDIYTNKIGNIVSYYAINFKSGGYVLVAGDDVIKPVLGYSVGGYFDINNLPPQLKMLLDAYSVNIKKIITDKQASSIEWNSIDQYYNNKNKSFVLPLCTTEWEQGCYYNALCPVDSSGPCNHVVTGCVATAMSQIMKYWNYPNVGQGSHSYTASYYGQLTADFGSTHYNWSLMPDVVDTVNDAVATLMFHTGVSVNMLYSATSSGSNIYYSASALPEYFKYSNNIEYVNKDNYTDSTWLNLIQNELNNGRPVLYSGYDTFSGHAWVCDGYDSNNFLHFNWGWGPGTDGYYEINNSFYSLNNSAVIKIMPVVSCDIKISEIIAPVSNTFYGPVNIKVRVSNYDTIPRANIPISYSIDGGPAVTEIISNSIAALSDTIYEFIQPYDFSPNPGHNYFVKVYSSYSCDTYKYNDTTTAIIENVECVMPPYSTGFEAYENMNGWIMQDVNNDNNTWVYVNGGNFQIGSIAYNSNSLTADDWLFSKCIQLDSGKVYKLSYYYKATTQYNPHKLSVYMGESQDTSDMTTLLVNDTNINNPNFLKKEIYLTVPLPGDYYFGWHCYSNPDELSLVLDDINIVEQTAIDVGVVATSLSQKNCDLQQEVIDVEVKNYCSTTLSNIPVCYQINNGPVVTEIINSVISPGGVVNYSFNTLADFSASGLYQIKIYTSLVDDTLFNNDTLNYEIANQISITPPYYMGFEPGEDTFGWEVYNANNDGYTWNLINYGGNNQPYCMQYSYSAWEAADDWLISPCAYLNENETYKLSFYYKVEDGQWPEKLNVYMGNNQNIDSLTTLLVDYSNLTNTNYLLSEIIFSVPTDDYYYFGWHCYSDPVMFNLYIDDISIDITTKTDKLENFESYNIYPNPASDELFINSTHLIHKIEILNMQGKSIYVKTIDKFNYSIDLSGFSRGVYNLIFYTEQGCIKNKIVII
ncbi:MAG: hypothetical protein Kow0068_00470 [Marinilabiliales bacterium]